MIIVLQLPLLFFPPPVTIYSLVMYFSQIGIPLPHERDVTLIFKSVQ